LGSKVLLCCYSLRSHYGSERAAAAAAASGGGGDGDRRGETEREKGE
jgi:hypothetical protein